MDFVREFKDAPEFKDGWYYRLADGYPWIGPFVTEHMAGRARAHVTSSARDIRPKPQWLKNLHVRRPWTSLPDTATRRPRVQDVFGKRTYGPGSSADAIKRLPSTTAARTVRPSRVPRSARYA